MPDLKFNASTAFRIQEHIYTNHKLYNIVPNICYTVYIGHDSRQVLGNIKYCSQMTFNLFRGFFFTIKLVLFLKNSNS